MSFSGMLGRVALVKTENSRGMHRYHHGGDKNQRARNVSSKQQLKHTAKVVTATTVPSSLIHFIPMIKAIRPSKTSLLTRATLRHIPEDAILHLQTNITYEIRRVQLGN
jgi:hypothetical protein